MDDARARGLALSALSLPPPPPRRTVLEEEEYDSTLSHIVTRDYYPSLPSLRRDAEVLDARGRGDVSGAVSARRRAREAEAEAERERAEREATGATGTGRPPLRYESVTGFHARATSEDDAEFESNQERERKEREAFLAVVYAARADGRGRLSIENRLAGGGGGGGVGGGDDGRPARASLWCDTPLGLSSDLYDAPPNGPRITGGTTRGDNDDDGSGGGGGGIGRNGLFFQPRHRGDVVVGLLTSGTAAPPGGTFLALDNYHDDGGDAAGKTRGRAEDGGGADAGSDGLLMPPPPARLPGAAAATSSHSRSVVPHRRQNDGNMAAAANATYETTTTPTADRRRRLGEYPPSGSGLSASLPDIHPPATRFPYQNESRLLTNVGHRGGCIVPSVPGIGIGIPRGMGWGAVVAGSLSTDASDVTDLDESPRPLDGERAARRRARERENETFVAMTPLIRPAGGGGGGGWSDDEPIMTWGDVASTPLVLGGGSAVDGRSSVDWEPARPAPAASSSSSGFEGESSRGPAFDVLDRSRREAMARRAEMGLSDRAKTYRAAGGGGGGGAGRGKDDESVRSSSRSGSAAATPLDRTASLTPAARALLEASKKSNAPLLGGGQSLASSSSRIFASPSNSASSSGAAISGINAGSRDSFGSALRASYTPESTSWSKEGDRKRKAPSSSLRRASAGATPRCQSLR